jgi:hypothetical protein
VLIKFIKNIKEADKNSNNESINKYLANLNSLKFLYTIFKGKLE